MKNLRKLFLVGYAAMAYFTAQPAAALHYEATSVSDLVSLKPQTDTQWVKPWGLFFIPNGNFWIADNHLEISTHYFLEDNHSDPLIHTAGFPTGAKFNAFPYAFLINNIYPATFLFSTESGTILGFNASVSPNNAVIVIDKSSSGATYKGLEIANSCCQQTFLFATDFFNAKVDKFNKNFQLVGSLRDSTLPPGYAPFNIKNINGLLYVTYAKQKLPFNGDDEAGTGHGFVDVFNVGGTFIKRLISEGHLNSPWGLALAPAHFGEFKNSLLVGNFGDGKILSYDLNTGEFLGELTDINNHPMQIDGLLSLEFDASGILYFTAGPNRNSQGSVGTIFPIP